MESNSDVPLQRTPSRASTASVKSNSSKAIRVKPRKQLSATSTAQTTPTTAETDKSLTSFPSLSPEDVQSPVTDRKFPINSLPQPVPKATSIIRKPKPSAVDDLISDAPSSRGRAGLFDDSPTTATQHVPGALHHGSDEHIRRLVAKTGIITLVRQLAEDLARRDAEITTFRRRAEERERELKKMLREVEVSNLDIETRLHKLDSYAVLNEQSNAEPVHHGQNSMRKDKNPTVTNGIYEMMVEAMNNDLAAKSKLDDDHLDTLGNHDNQATIKATGIIARDTDDRSVALSSHSVDKSTETVKGWKDYIWSGTGTSRKTSRASSIMSDYDAATGPVTKMRSGSATGPKRKGLNEALFKPPQRKNTYHSDNFIGAAELDGAARETKEEKSRTSSMTSWTKIFGGNPHTARDADSQVMIRGRSATTGTGLSKASRNPSANSAPTANSAQSSLMKVKSKSSNTQNPRKQFQLVGLSLNGVKKGIAQPLQNVPPGSPASVDTGSNLGPVEMDTILPHSSRPPTLTPSYQNADDAEEYLTDRFGFIYDNRRRKHEVEAFSRTRGAGTKVKEMLSVLKDVPRTDATDDQQPERPDTPASTDDRASEKPAKKWQDYLKIATFPTELLSHTPSSGTIMTLGNADIRKSLKRSPTFGDHGENGKDMPSLSPNPLPSASSITANNAEIAKPSIGRSLDNKINSKPETEPVKLLLAQLTELHDSLQRDKTVKWNDFLRKVRVERQKEGELASSADSRSHQANMPEASLADGEMIGIATLGNKGKVGRAKYKEFKALVLAGIPVVHRAKIWLECSGASALRVPGYYDDLIKNGMDDPVILAQIQMDINRTLTDNVFFRNGPGVVKLNEVLLAYSRRNPEVGYCQGMNLITASVLLIMPTAEDAFWVLVSIIENILPRHYYDNSLLTSRADQQVLRQYVSELLPRLSAHLDALGIELEALTFQWFLSLFTDCLSAEALYRVWDVLLCCKDEDGNGGSTFLFQVALALLKLNEGHLIACETPGEVYAYLGGEITNHAISIDGLIRASEGLKGLVRRGEVEERRAKWVMVEKDTIKERERIRKSSYSKGRKKTEVCGSNLQNGHREAVSPMPVDA